MKAILMSIHNEHILNIHSNKKTNELRTSPPKIECPFKVYVFDTTSSGGCGKVVSEWICDRMVRWHIYMGVPIHLTSTGCVSAEDILKYTNRGQKDLTAMHISNLVIYDTPKELSEFEKPWKEWIDKNGTWHDIRPCQCGKPCEHAIWDDAENCECCSIDYDGENCPKIKIKTPPQSWCYVEELRGVK